MPYRIDNLGTLKAPHKTREGFIFAEAFATRSGVLDYQNPDGSVRREYRPPDEVSRADSLGSLARKPVTLRHPRHMVSPETAAEVSQGAVGESEEYVADGFVKVTVSLHRKDAINAINRGMRELSSGYECDLDMTPGIVPEGQPDAGQRYDAIQRNIQYNHLALVERGRAGQAVRLRADGAIDFEEDAPMPDEKTPETATTRQDAPQQAAPAAPTATPATPPQQISHLEVDGRRYDAAEIRALRAKADELQGQVDSANSTARADQADKERLDYFNERQDLLGLARSLKVEQEAVANQPGRVKADEMPNLTLSQAVAKAFEPGIKAEDLANPHYVRGVIGSARRDVASRTTKLDSLARAVSGAKPEPSFQDKMRAAQAKADKQREDDANAPTFRE